MGEIQKRNTANREDALRLAFLALTIHDDDNEDDSRRERDGTSSTVDREGRDDSLTLGSIVVRTSRAKKILQAIRPHYGPHKVRFGVLCVILYSFPHVLDQTEFLILNLLLSPSLFPLFSITVIIITHHR